MNVDQLAESLRSDPMFMQNVVRWDVLPARPAVYEPFPDSLDPRLLPVLEKRGVHQLYRHQAHAIREVLAGRDVVVVTPTASGKTMCYSLPVLSAILQNDDARALYLFPTKALSADQVSELYELIEAMAECDKVCTHLHLPLQSGSTEILKKMNRKYTKESYLSLVERIREKNPKLSLTTDIIVGFPGETEEDFEDTLDVVRKVRYDSAYTFIYSKRTGTPAAAMENQVPEEVVKERFDRLLHEVQGISAEITKSIEGETVPVLVEEINTQNEELLTGRLSNNAVVHFPGDVSLVGEILPVKLVESKGFYYMGEIVS